MGFVVVEEVSKPMGFVPRSGSARTGAGSSAVLINRITNFSYYYSTSRLIICFFYLVIITNSESRTVTRAVKASLFPQLGRACRDCMALRISLVGQRCSRVEGECPGARIPSLFAVRQTVMGGLKLQDFILFSGDFTARPSELNPDGAYLERIRRAAF